MDETVKQFSTIFYIKDKDMASDIEHDYLLKKIDQIETRLEGHVVKIEQRLDQMVSLMQAVTSLQEKETRNADSIKDVKTTLKESLDKFDKTIGRIHDRLDKLDDISDMEGKEIISKTSALSTNIKEVDDKVSKWMNRGIGLWIGVSALVVVLQTGGALVLNSFKDEYLSTKSQIIEISKRQNEIEQDITRINSNIRNLHTPPK